MVWPTLGSRKAKEQNRTSVVKVIWQQAVSPPYMNGSVVFSRLRQCALHLIMLSWAHPSPNLKRHLAWLRQNIVLIDQTIAIFRLFKMAAVGHLGFVMCMFGHPGRVFGVLYHCAKFGSNRCSSFDSSLLCIIQVLIFNEFEIVFARNVNRKAHVACNSLIEIKRLMKVTVTCTVKW